MAYAFSSVASGNWSSPATWHTAYNITAVNQGTKKFTIAGDHVGEFNNNLSTITVTGANAGLYTVSFAALVSSNTEITVTGTIASSTVNGTVLANTYPGGLTPTDNISINHAVTMDVTPLNPGGVSIYVDPSMTGGKLIGDGSTYFFANFGTIHLWKHAILDGVVTASGHYVEIDDTVGDGFGFVSINVLNSNIDTLNWNSSAVGGNCNLNGNGPLSTGGSVITTFSALSTNASCVVNAGVIGLLLDGLGSGGITVKHSNITQIQFSNSVITIKENCQIGDVVSYAGVVFSSEWPPQYVPSTVVTGDMNLNNCNIQNQGYPVTFSKTSSLQLKTTGQMVDGGQGFNFYGYIYLNSSTILNGTINCWSPLSLGGLPDDTSTANIRLMNSAATVVNITSDGGMNVKYVGPAGGAFAAMHLGL